MRLARFLPLVAALAASASCTFPEYAVRDAGVEDDATVDAVLIEDSEAETSVPDSGAPDTRSDSGADAKTSDATGDAATDTTGDTTGDATGDAKSDAPTDAPTDAPVSDGDATPPLPSDCIAMGLRYIRCQRSTTWGEARAFCQSRGGDLLRINTSTENGNIATLLNPYPVTWRWYIGLNDMAAEGTYVWADGTSSLLYKNWATGQPSLTATNDCASIRGDGFWQTESCTGLPRPEGLLCEL